MGRALLYAGCAVVSAYILASGYESVYSRPLPLVHTLATVDLSLLDRAYGLAAVAAPKPAYYGQFGKPSTLTIPGQDGPIRLSVVDPVRHGSDWLARASTMHLLIPDKPLNGNISTAVMYCRGGFRTISPDRLPAAGTNLFVDTDQNWRYVYKVGLAKTYATSYPYVPGDLESKGKLVIFCNDTADHANEVIEGSLISVQAVTQ